LKSFADLGLDRPLLDVLASERYDTPTPIQAQAIPHVLEGRDLLGIAQTGTGKTAAFALPILQRLAARPGRAQRRCCRALVLSPTRELANQITESFRTYGRKLNLTCAAVYGGVGAVPQIKAMGRGVDILVATPGRLLDHLGQGNIRLDQVEIFVLDEADQMLDMGFIVPIRKVVAALGTERQTLFFSATMPKDIRRLAGELLDNPREVSVTPEATTVERVEQRVMFVDAGHKPALLAELLADKAMRRALVFTRTKRGADKVARGLGASGINAEAIHGNKTQSQRQKVLDGFKAGRTRVLVATDVAARGIDVDAVTHVVNFELPNVPESYVHRIGRTARAGAAGIAYSFCDPSEKKYLRDIEKLIKRPIATAANPLGAANDDEPRQRRDRDEDRDEPRRKPHRGQPAGKKYRARKPAGNKAGGGGGAKQQNGPAKPGGDKPFRRSRPRAA
jgi:ATP-dependent RNA helicase RhlE